jgi:lincosamide nucleotidyltransferase A/C/D/E
LVLDVEEHDVLAVLDAVARAGTPAWVAGGWGIDALIGHPTREHDDLDLAIRSQDQEPVIRALRGLGFDLVQADDWRPSRFGMRDSAGRKIDLHLLAFDASGSARQVNLPGLPPFEYPSEGFVEGRIGDRKVPCLSPYLQVQFHRGYQWTSKDQHDMRLLRTKFRIQGNPAGSAP